MSDPTMIVCPRCEAEFSVDGVKSKRHNQFIICKVCGLEESMIDWYRIKQLDDQIPGEVMQRETVFVNKIEETENPKQFKKVKR